MNCEKSIEITNLSKGYKFYKNKWLRLLEWILPGKKKYHEFKWVLQNLNLEVNKGESLGIIGVNGAGKSTILKIITGTSIATDGEIKIKGKVIALLELGLGFHPEFTGRENIYIAGQLLGFPADVINENMLKIEQFAEIGQYIDMPIRTYSSGMQMRLAFSVATMVRPDILIIDEALSVGDYYFQHKCYDRINEFRKKGTTLLLVSHDKEAIQAICDRAVLLEAGKIIKTGKPEYIMDYYNALLNKEKNNIIEEKVYFEETASIISGNRKAIISKILLLNEEGQNVAIINVGDKLTVLIEVQINHYVSQLVLGIMIKNVRGQSIYGTNTHLEDKILYELLPGERVQYKFEFIMNIGIGNYSITTALTRDTTHIKENYQWCERICLFEVINSKKNIFEGLVWLNSDVSIKRLNNKE